MVTVTYSSFFFQGISSQKKGMKGKYVWMYSFLPTIGIAGNAERKYRKVNTNCWRCIRNEFLRVALATSHTLKRCSMMVCEKPTNKRNGVGYWEARTSYKNNFISQQMNLNAQVVREKWTCRRLGNNAKWILGRCLETSQAYLSFPFFVHVKYSMGLKYVLTSNSVSIC